jgi:hypothetical protein
MATPLGVNSFAAKSHDAPDERRTPPKTQVDIVNLEPFTIGRFTFQPGWRWSECIKPVVGTETCQLSHVIRLPDGREEAIRAGESYTIPPGHDAWVDGDEPFVGIEVMSAAQFAKA